MYVRRRIFYPLEPCRDCSSFGQSKVVVFLFTAQKVECGICAAFKLYLGVLREINSKYSTQ